MVSLSGEEGRIKGRIKNHPSGKEAHTKPPLRIRGAHKSSPKGGAQIYPPDKGGTARSDLASPIERRETMKLSILFRPMTAVLLGIVMGVGITPAFAVDRDPPNLFELDGNMVINQKEKK